VTPSFLYDGVSLPNADPAAAVVLPVRIGGGGRHRSGSDRSISDIYSFIFEN
jgi:hypothetical protein